MTDVGGRCTVNCATIRGVRAEHVEVEVAVSSGLPGFHIVGMTDVAIQESRVRVKAAIRSSGFSMPNELVVVNLAPSALRKSGTGFDLAIAVGILIVTGQVPPDIAKGKMFVGELSLEGAVRPVDGLLAYSLAARDLGARLGLRRVWIRDRRDRRRSASGCGHAARRANGQFCPYSPNRFFG